MSTTFKLFQIALPFICVLVFTAISESKKYDLESVKVKVDYGNLKPPPANDKWEYLTFMQEHWLFLSTHENDSDVQRKDCSNLHATYHSAGVEGYKDLTYEHGVTTFSESLRNAVFDLLVKLKVTSIWDGSLSTGNVNYFEGQPDEECELWKFDSDNKKFRPVDVKCKHNHTALCSFRDTKPKSDPTTINENINVSV